MSPAVATRQRDPFTWALVQLGLLLALPVVLLAGAFDSISRRRFHWRAFVFGTLALLLLISCVGVVALGDFGVPREWRDLVLWGGWLGAFMLSGAVVARAGRRVGLFETYLAVLLAALFTWAHLYKGWDVLLGIGPGDSESYLEFLGTAAPGARLFGPMWVRLLILAAVGGLIMAIFGGSVAYMFYGDEGRLQWRMGVEWTVARRHLQGRRGMASVTAIVAVVGISLGVSTLVTVTAVMSGYQGDVQDKILSTNAHLVVQKYGLDFVEHDEISKKALAVGGVVAATPFSFNEAMLSDGEIGLGVLLKGIDPETAGSVTSIEENLCSVAGLDGSCLRGAPSGGLAAALVPVDGLPSIVVGSGLFQKLGRPLGSVVTITTPVGIAGARGNAPKRMEARLGGVFRSGMHEFDTKLTYMALPDAQRLMGMGKAVNGVEFRVSDPDGVELIEAKVLRAIGTYPYRTLDWHELNIGIFTALKLQKIVMFIVLCFIVVVAAVNIASTLFRAVVEKSREIGVLKSMGARDVGIMKIFVLEGWLVGGIGTVLGLAGGLAVCELLGRLHIGIAADVYMVESLEVLVSPVEVTLTALSALVISHLATVYPALKAARQAPVDAMRY